jgi:hypothetical protein
LSKVDQAPVAPQVVRLGVACRRRAQRTRQGPVVHRFPMVSPATCWALAICAYERMMTNARYLAGSSTVAVPIAVRSSR